MGDTTNTSDMVSRLSSLEDLVAEMRRELEEAHEAYPVMLEKIADQVGEQGRRVKRLELALAKPKKAGSSAEISEMFIVLGLLLAGFLVLHLATRRGESPAAAPGAGVGPAAGPGAGVGPAAAPGGGA